MNILYLNGSVFTHAEMITFSHPTASIKLYGIFDLSTSQPDLGVMDLMTISSSPSPPSSGLLLIRILLELLVLQAFYCISTNSFLWAWYHKLSVTYSLVEWQGNKYKEIQGSWTQIYLPSVSCVNFSPWTTVLDRGKERYKYHPASWYLLEVGDVGDVWAVEMVLHESTILGKISSKVWHWRFIEFLCRLELAGLRDSSPCSDGKGSCWRCRSGRILTIEISEQARRKYTRKQVLRYCLLSEILLVLRNHWKAWWYLVHMLSSVSCGLNGWETRTELQLLVLRLARQGWGDRTWADGIIIACKLNAWAHGTHFFLRDIEGHSHPFLMLFVIHTDIKIN